MAQKTVTVCDRCGMQGSDSSKVLPAFFAKNGDELCFNCAYKELRSMYGLPEDAPANQTPVPSSNGKPADPLPPDTEAFLIRKGELEVELDCTVYPVKPKVPVQPGQEIEYGNPVKRVLIIERCPGNEAGVWFARILGQFT